jgi:hypothetical protein
MKEVKKAPDIVFPFRAMTCIALIYTPSWNTRISIAPVSYLCQPGLADE